MKSKFIAVKIVPTDLLNNPGFKYEVNNSYWIDPWAITKHNGVITFGFQVMERESCLYSERFMYSTEVVHYGYRWLPHKTRIFIKEYEGFTPILFRRCK